jgi:hypothetical protein
MTPMKPFRLPALAIALLLAACTASPTDPARLDSTAASYDEGPGMLGSGNSSGEENDGGSTTDDGGNMVGSGNFTSDSTGTGSGTERGGGSLGSGN